MTECFLIPKSAGNEDINLPVTLKEDTISVFDRVIQWFAGRRAADTAHQTNLFTVHFRKNVIAACADGALVSLFDVDTRSWSTEVKIHHNSREYGTAQCMKWNQSSNSLLIGTSRGLCIWNFGDLILRSTSSVAAVQPWLRFLPHPRQLGVNDCVASPQGRLVVTISFLDSVVYIWDYALGVCTPLYCLSGVNAKCIAWSPTGSSILVTAQNGDVVIVDAARWDSRHICSTSSSHHITVMDSSVYLIAVQGTENLYVVAAESPGALNINKVSRGDDMILPTPIKLDTTFLSPGSDSRKFGSVKVSAEGAGGQYIAVSLAEVEEGCLDLSQKTPLPLVAVYSVDRDNFRVSYVCHFSGSGIDNEIDKGPSRRYPVQFHFVSVSTTGAHISARLANSRQLCLCIMWSDDSMTYHVI